MSVPPDWSTVAIAVPHPALRRPGVAMAGFRQRRPATWDIAMVAHPSVTVLLNLAADDDGLVCGAGTSRRCGSVVAGLLPGDLRATGRVVDCLQIRLDPVASAAAFGGPDLTGVLVSLDELWGRDATRLEDRLRAASGWDERFAIATGFLARRLDAPPVDPEVAHTWRRTHAGRGRVSVEGLAEEVGWSRKRLWSRFRGQLGISPKRAARLVRFDHAAHLLAAGRPAAEVAAESGYVDQSHLHREVRAFAGLTPSAVAAAPWLAIDDTAWPASVIRGERRPHTPATDGGSP